MKHPPERLLIIVQDTREPHADAGDHPDAVFRPRVFPPNIPRDTPIADRPRAPCAIVRQKLDVGDYSLPGLTHAIALERKSGPDLLATLFGGEGVTALGEARKNQDRFRAEFARAKGYALFALVAEVSEGWLFTEARRRFERYGKSFDPFQALALLRSFAVDLGVPTIWTGTKGLAELEVGCTLARVWSQATGGEKARDARTRGMTMPWLDVLRDVQSPVGHDVGRLDVVLAPQPSGQPCSFCEGSGDPCACNDGKAGPPLRLAPAGGLTDGYAAGRSGKRRTG